MKIVIAMDSFKGSMTSLEAGNAAKEGVLEKIPDVQVVVKPLADGGEGTMEALLAGIGGERISVRVQDPLGREIAANYAIVTGAEQEEVTGQGMRRSGEKTAIIEMAQAAGLTLLSEEERDPKKASTFGVGQMICDAIERGCRDFVVGIGGSATNDGGVGMLQALGFRFLDENGDCVRNLMPHVHRIDSTGARTELADCRFRVACDVTNPLCGPNGATYVYAGQKGLQPEEFEKADADMAAYAEAVMKFTGKDHSRAAGAGAAGGMGFAFIGLLGGVLIPGAELTMQVTGLYECMKDADIFLTGEGRIDGQTTMGKAPWVAARMAKNSNPECRVFALTGQRNEELKTDEKEKEPGGFDNICVITPPGMPLEQAMQKETAMENMRCAVRELICREEERRRR